MSVKLALLKSGDHVIADIKELISENNIVGYLFRNPHKIAMAESLYLTEDAEDDGSISVSFSPWVLFTNEKEIPVRPEWLVTVVEPVGEIKKMYEEQINGTDSEVSFTEESDSINY